MGLTRLLFQNPLLFAGVAVALLYSVIAHEVAHGWVAHLLGDDTALRNGRLTLNPLPHLDLIGTLMLFFVGFGWAKPVPVNYRAAERHLQPYLAGDWLDAIRHGTILIDMPSLIP